MKILIVTDAWEPQVNGVVRTLKTTQHQLEKKGHQVRVLSPQDSSTIPCPTYNEISLAVSPFKAFYKTIDEFYPEAIHIATEGPLGWASRSVCKHSGWQFTTSFHTRFPEYVHARTHLPESWFYRLLKRFHSRSQAVMVTTPSMKRKLSSKGFENLGLWSRGVDTALFQPEVAIQNRKRPQLLYVGRVAVEKNLEAFLDLKMEADKVVVGDGPQLQELKNKYKDVHFTGAKFGQELVTYYAQADCFVFPSQTDTFGLVMLEAMACGTPVAAFPTEGPIDVIQSERVGCLDKNLHKAVEKALGKSRSECRKYALEFSWEKASQQFFRQLVPSQL